MEEMIVAPHRCLQFKHWLGEVYVAHWCAPLCANIKSRKRTMVTIRRWPQIIAWWVELNFHCASNNIHGTQPSTSRLMVKWPKWRSWAQKWHLHKRRSTNLLVQILSQHGIHGSYTLLCGSPLWAWKSEGSTGCYQISKAPQWKSERAHMLFPSAPETPEAVWHQRHQVEQTCPIARRAQVAPLDTKHFVVDFFLQKTA